MSVKELRKWKRECEELLKKAIKEADEYMIDYIIEEIAFIKAELGEYK